jgi:hypothetical protein
MNPTDPKGTEVPIPAALDLVLHGTSMELGMQVFERCAAPALKHLQAAMGRTLAPEAAAEHILRLWAGFMSPAVGAMVATVGVNASQVLLAEMSKMADALPNAAKGGMH